MLTIGGMLYTLYSCYALSSVNVCCLVLHRHSFILYLSVEMPQAQCISIGGGGRDGGYCYI